MAIPAEIQAFLSSALPASGTMDVEDVRQRIRTLQDKHAVTLSEIAKKQASDLAAARAELKARIAELEAELEVATEVATEVAGETASPLLDEEAVQKAVQEAVQEALAEQERRLTQEYEEAIGRLRHEKGLTLEALETDARQQIDMLSQEHEAAMEAVLREHRATVEALEKAHQDALSNAAGKDETDGGALAALEENWRSKVVAAEKALADANARFQSELEAREAKNASFIAQLQNENRAQTTLLKESQGSVKELEELRRKIGELETRLQEQADSHQLEIAKLQSDRQAEEARVVEAARAEVQTQLDELNAAHSDELAARDEKLRKLTAELQEQATAGGGADPAEVKTLRAQIDAIRIDYEQKIRDLQHSHLHEMMDMREQLDESHMGLGPEAAVQRATNAELQSMQAMVEAERLQMLEAMQTVAAVEAEGQRKLQKLRDEQRKEREELKGHLTALSQAFRNSQTNDPSAVEKIGQIIALLLSQHR